MDTVTGPGASRQTSHAEHGAKKSAEQPGCELLSLCIRIDAGGASSGGGDDDDAGAAAADDDDAGADAWPPPGWSMRNILWMGMTPLILRHVVEG